MTNPQNGKMIFREVEFDPFAELRHGPFPTTPPQREIWTNIRIGGYAANCAYNESVSLSLKGDFDAEVFRKSAAEVILRHDALRSVFSNDGLTFTVSEDAEPQYTFHDFTNLTEDEKSSAVTRIQSEEVSKEFDLQSGKLARFTVIRKDSGDHIVVLTFHHIVCDGWSLGIVMQDLGAIYSLLKNGSGPGREPAVSFADYALEEQLFHDTRAEDYWTSLFRNNIPVLDLPTDKPRPALRTFNASRIDVSVRPELVDRIRKIGAAQGCSYVTTLLVAFEVFLYRITGSQDIITGVPAAGQSLDGRESLVGHAVNLLPIRAAVDPQLSFNQYLRARKPLILDAYDHQHYTFGSLLNRLNIPRDPSRIPLVPVSFNVDLGITNGVAFEGCSMEFSTNPRCYENFELFINATGSGNKLTFECTFNTDLFGSDTILSRIHGFVELLESIGANPENPIFSLNLLLPGEKQKLLYDWNSNTVAYDRSKCIHQLFEKVVSDKGDDIAVQHRGNKITYRELNERSNRLARFLMDQGAGPEVFIGVCLDRTIDMVVALYAVLKSGSGYVPVDPVYPADRIAFILGDSGAQMVLTDAGSKKMLPELDIRVFELERIETAVYDGSNPETSVHSGNPAYCIYTSGSTGKPKGVIIEHRNVVALTAWAAVYFTPEQLTGVLGSTTICFDLSVFELFVTLCLGGRLVLVKDVLELTETGSPDEIRLVNTVPSAFAALIKTGRPIPETINTIILCGEPLPVALVDQIYALPGIKQVVDLYGPTEDTVYSTVTLRKAGEPPTIGKVIPNSRLYLLDPFMQPVPIGLPGEIYLGGDGVARGYLNRPELTAERFVPDPFVDNPAARLYRTGDMARFRKDGNLEFIGRADNQVKVRGFRIELGEIETLLMKYQGVKECAVVVREDEPGDKRIAAYLVRQGDGNADLSGLREHLRKELPEYMVPSHFIWMDSLPKTPNGKLDRKALPRPDVLALTISGFEEPSTPVEEALAAIWCNVLGIEKVGRKDNFFELGGHSLLAVQMFNMVEQQMGVKMELALIFRAPTIEELALIFNNDESSKPWTCMVPLQPNGSKTPLFCIHMHNGNINRWRVMLKYLGSDQPVYAIQPRGLDPRQEPHRNLEEMAAFYISLIRQIQPFGPYRLLGLCFSGMVAFEMGLQLQAAGQKVSFLGMINNYAPPENPAMYRVKTGINKFMKMEMGERFQYFMEKNKFIGNTIFSKARNMLGGPSRVEEVQIDEQKEVLGHDLRSIHSLALLNYHPVQIYQGDITVIRTGEPLEAFYDEKMGWKRLVTGKIEISSIAGCDNDSIITKAPYNITLSCMVRDYLAALKD